MSKIVDASRIVQFYEQYINEHGFNSGWISMESACQGYEAATQGKRQRCREWGTVLDVGCGQGGLLGYLQDHRDFHGEYLGLDLMHSFLSRAADENKGRSNANFIQSEFLDHDFDGERFDWSFCLGAISVRQPEQQRYEETVLVKLASLSRVGMTLYVNDIRYTEPERLDLFPDLVVHDVPALLELLSEKVRPTDIEIIHYPTEPAQQTVIHLSF